MKPRITKYRGSMTAWIITRGLERYVAFTFEEARAFVWRLQWKT